MSQPKRNNKRPPRPEDARRALIRRGSLPAAEGQLKWGYKCNQQLAEEMVADAALEMVASAPPPLRASFDLVIAWSRWNDLYDRSSQALDRKGMMEAQKGMDAIIKGLH